MKLRLEIVIVLLVIAIVCTHTITKTSGVHITIVNFENFSLASFLQSDPYNKTREGYFEKANKGTRVWSKIPNDLWLELYPDSKEHIFHLYRKIRLDNVDKCDGEILQRVSIKTLDDKSRMYYYDNSPSPLGQIFMPKDIKCSNQLLNRYDDNSQWGKLFPVQYK